MNGGGTFQLYTAFQKTEMTIGLLHRPIGYMTRSLRCLGPNSLRTEPKWPRTEVDVDRFLCM